MKMKIVILSILAIWEPTLLTSMTFAEQSEVRDGAHTQMLGEGHKTSESMQHMHEHSAKNGSNNKMKEISSETPMMKQGEHSKMKSKHHSGHMQQSVMSTKDSTLISLQELPMSGGSREAGSDGRYIMESTSTLNDLQTQCAQASRGLIMLDNVQWQNCGGRPKGIPMVTVQNQKGQIGHSQH